MKDAYGKTIEIGAKVVFNYNNHLAFGIVREAKEEHHFASGGKSKKIVVEFEKPPNIHLGYQGYLDGREDKALVKCNQVLVVVVGQEEPILATRARAFRDKYGCGIIEAQKALQMAGNDEQKALELIRLPFGMQGKYFEEWEKKNEVD